MTVRLKDLRESNEFLNSVIENMNSAVFIIDASTRIRQVNNVLPRLFRKTEEDMLDELCGNALGCAFAVRENSPCGATSHCGECMMRCSFVDAFSEGNSRHRQMLAKEFYIGGKPVLKYLEFTTKRIHFEGHEMVLVIVDDMTDAELLKQELVRKQKAIQEDLKAAAGIQQSLLPQRPPDVRSLRFAWRSMPCDMIGGDIFSVFGLDREHIGGYMLDVSGHGVPAALVSVSIYQSLRPAAPDEATMSPSEVCRALDREYPFERFGTYFTLIYFLLNHRKGVLTYSNAGHPPMVLVRRNGSMDLLDAGGSIIGLVAEEPFEQGMVQLAPGDRLFLYTDGIVERRSDEGVFFGNDRLHQMLRDSRESPLDSVIAGVMDALLQFGSGKIRDDVSILAIEYTGTGE